MLICRTKKTTVVRVPCTNETRISRLVDTSSLLPTQRTIPTKIFREAVLSFVVEDNRFDGQIGHHLKSLPTAERLMRPVEAVIRREAQVVEDQLWRNEILLLRGEVTFKDLHAVLVNVLRRNRSSISGQDDAQCRRTMFHSRVIKDIGGLYARITS